MNKPLKAALFSAFIFPGTGQLWLKKYFTAVYFAFFSCIGLYLLFSDLLSRAQEILEEVQLSEVTMDLASITELVQQQSAITPGSLTPAFTIFLVAWLVSVIEAYRVGKKLENTDNHQ